MRKIFPNCVQVSCFVLNSFFNQNTSMQQNTISPVRQQQRPTVRSPAPDSKNGTDPDILKVKGFKLELKLSHIVQ